MKISTAALLIILPLLISCAPADISGAGRHVRVIAPNVIQYSRKLQAAAAVEVQQNSCPVLIEFAKDHHVMREQSRKIK